MNSFLEISATVMGFLMSVSYFLQAWEMYKNKSSENVSVPSFVIFGIGTFAWFIYGLSIKDIPIILGFVAGVVGSWLVLALIFVYRKPVYEK